MVSKPEGGFHYKERARMDFWLKKGGACTEKPQRKFAIKKGEIYHLHMDEDGKWKIKLGESWQPISADATASRFNVVEPV